MSSRKEFKWLWSAMCLLSIFLCAKCQAVGDDCQLNNIKGTCTHLENCTYLYNEVIEAGRPIPINIARKLTALRCGFDGTKALVCCSGIDFFTRISPNASTYNVTQPIGPPDVTNHRNIILLPQRCGISERDRISRGRNAHLFEYPWMVLLVYDAPKGIIVNCGGSLINERYVLTAAHCVNVFGGIKLHHVVLGELEIGVDPDCEAIDEEDIECAPSAQNITIGKVISHPGYSQMTLRHDIALIRLSQRVTITDSVQPICLPITPDLQRQNLTGSMGEVAGWGITETGAFSTKLQSAVIPFLSNNYCKKIYSFIHDDIICAGGLDNKEACPGDSGGPLTFSGKINPKKVREIQRGVVALGAGKCGNHGRPGLFTNVAYYMDWILDNMYE